MLEASGMIPRTSLAAYSASISYLLDCSRKHHNRDQGVDEVRGRVTVNTPNELDSDINLQVLKYISPLSAHSDVVDELKMALSPLGDIQEHSPKQHAYVAASTNGVIFAVALGMSTIAFRLDRRMQSRALASGAAELPECGVEWVTFELFRDDWPRHDLVFWARKAFVAARELRQ
jgi:hypothetical protein